MRPCQHCRTTADTTTRYDSDTCETCRYLESTRRFGDTKERRDRAAIELARRELLGAGRK